QEAIQYAHPKQAHLDPDIMRKAVDDWDTTEASFDKGSRAYATLRDEMRRLRPLAFPKPVLLLPRPMFDDTAPSDAPSDEAAQTDAPSVEAAQTDAPSVEAAQTDAPADEDNATPSDETT